MASLAFSLVHRSLLSSGDLLERDYKSAKDFRDHCTLQTCSLKLSYWGYLPSLAANSVFLALFSLSTLLFLFQAILSKRFLGFTIAMVSGCALEVVGYIGRIMSHHNPFDEVCYIKTCAKEGL